MWFKSNGFEWNLIEKKKFSYHSPQTFMLTVTCTAIIQNNSEAQRTVKCQSKN